MLIISLPIKEAIDRHRHVSRLGWTSVKISIVLRKKIDIMEDETLEVILLQSLGCSHI